jgi:hypothetical protein
MTTSILRTMGAAFRPGVTTVALQAMSPCPPPPAVPQQVQDAVRGLWPLAYQLAQQVWAGQPVTTASTESLMSYAVQISNWFRQYGVQGV